MFLIKTILNLIALEINLTAFKYLKPKILEKKSLEKTNFRDFSYFV